MEAIFGLVVVLLLLYALIYGGIKTFQRNWIVALLLLIFLTGFWFIWALFECFTDPIE